MNLKELLIPLSLALLGTWLIQYFFFPGQEPARVEIAADRSFIAPTSVQVAEPLDFEIDFSDAPSKRAKEVTIINLPHRSVHFSNDGAIIEFMGYNRTLGGKETLLEVILPEQGRERGAFLVALNGLGSTPYYYTLTGKQEDEKGVVVTYKGESAAAVVTKQFMLHRDTYQIDLTITVEPKGKDVQARLFFPSPPAVDGGVQAILSTQKKAIEKKPIKDLVQFGKERPSLFGLEDHYFLNVLIKDPEFFAHRAYFAVGIETAEAILQSASVTKPMTWHLSFYAGPKELKALNVVDPRLEGVLDYGIFGPLSKLLLFLLNFFFGLVGNYGVAIILVTLLVRLILLPFTLKGEQSQRKHAEAQKRLTYLQQKYKDDPERLAHEKAEFARKHGVPGLLGCLPMFLQLPIFIGLQRVLNHAIELYRAPFLWIPDLSARDPYYILPVLLGVGIILTTSQTGDPRQRIANIVIAIIVAAVTANLSAGLSLFICVSTFLGLAQTAVQKALKV